MPGSKMLCERVEILGVSRLKHLKKFANSIKVKVSCVNPSSRPPNDQVCFQRNVPVGIGMCPKDQWGKLSKGLWIRMMSPFDNKLLDIRVAGSADEPLENFACITLCSWSCGKCLAAFLSQSLAFYYTGAMAGMRLLPTGWKSLLAIFVYSSIVGLGFFLLRYVPRLLRSFLTEIGIGEDMYTPISSNIFRGCNCWSLVGFLGCSQTCPYRRWGLECLIL